jgi:hypothetical protein
MMMGRGDTFGTAFMNLAFQLKSFSMGTMRNYRFLSNKDMVAAPLARKVQFVTMLTALGGVSLLTDDIINGKTPRDPTALDENSPVLGNFLVQSLLKSGSMPFLADYLLTDYAAAGGNLTKDMLGPSGRLATDLTDVVATLARAVGDGELEAKKLVNPALRWLPGSNIWYAKGMLNNFVLDRVRASVDPKFNAKQHRALEKSSGDLWEQQHYGREAADSLYE